MVELHLRNLPVPFLSQRKNTYVWKEGDVEVSMAYRTCNITCLAMVLHYFGITNDTPDKMMSDYFSSTSSIIDKKTVDAFETWDNLSAFLEMKKNSALEAEAYKDVTDTHAIYWSETGVPSKGFTIQDLRDNIAAGYPVMISVASTYASTEGSGHRVVVRGFTKIVEEGKEIEYIILNDPWGSPVNIDNNRQRGAGSLHAYYEYREIPDDGSNDASNGDNIVLKVSEFQNMIKKVSKVGRHTDGYAMHGAMVIRANLWQKPDGTETSDANALFPMNADFMWHSGIHLSIQKEIHSIGAGRLLAVRNKDAINGSASFMLVKHQVAGKKVGKILPFYALYMHTDSINIKKCAEEYFKYGRLPKEYNFKWLLQLFSNMLPHQYVIKNSSQQQKIFNARIQDSELMPMEEL